MKYLSRNTHSKTGKTYIDSEDIKSQKYNKQTIQKAIGWLREQPQDLTGHITDVNLAVRLYLNSQKKEKKNKSSFAEELRKFSGIKKNSQKNRNIISETLEPDSPVLSTSIAVNPSSSFVKSQGVSESLCSKDSVCNEEEALASTTILSINSSVAEERAAQQKPLSKRLKNGSVSLKRETVLKEREEENPYFLLDIKSKEALEKAQSQLNIPAREALKVLIQLGYHSLETLLNRR